MPNHIHLMVDLPPSLALADFVKSLKNSTNNWLKANPNFPLFTGWSIGYAGLSCSANDIDRVVKYIKKQKEHHYRMSFADEIRAILVNNGIKIDERYFNRDWLD